MCFKSEKHLKFIKRLKGLRLKNRLCFFLFVCFFEGLIHVSNDVSYLENDLYVVKNKSQCFQNVCKHVICKYFP